MSKRCSVLVITATPDRRPSSDDLDRIIEELRLRPGVQVDRWYLRSPERRAPDGEVVVDSLRTWLPAAALRTVGLTRLGRGLQGRRLRGWLRDLDPDVVLLDDGLGDRILPYAPRPPAVVARSNNEPPVLGELEPPPDSEPSLVLVGSGRPDPDLPAERWFRLGPELLVGRAFEQLAADVAAARAADRERVGAPGSDLPVVSGWGEDGWLDGPDLFIRTLWHLQDRHGIVARGIWHGLPPDHHEAERLRAEAVRCGLAGRFDLVPVGSVAEHVAAEAGSLPFRLPADYVDLVPPAMVGVPVVTFDPVPAPAVWVTGVPLLDLDGAAAALARAVEGWTDPAEVERRHRSADSIRVSAVVDRILAAGPRSSP